MPLYRQGRAQFIHRHGLRFEAEVLAMTDTELPDGTLGVEATRCYSQPRFHRQENVSRHR